MDERQAKLGVAKAEYRTALRNLESISEEIHAHRRSLAMGTREQGVGAEGEGGDEDISNFKVESDGLSSECNRDYSLVMTVFLHAKCPFLVCVCVSVVSVSIDDESSRSSSSEDEAANRASISPQISPTPPSPTGSTPSGTPFPYPPLSPCSSSSSPTSSSCLDGLDLASPCCSQDADSVCGSGHVSPLLGPRSQCSGASSPDCDQERGVCSLRHRVAATLIALIHCILGRRA